MPEITENQRKALEDANKWTKENITTWADLYQFLHQRAFLYIGQERSLATADMTVACLYSFVHALEDLPEEGDAQKIAIHMNEILLLQPERLGMHLTVISGDDVIKAAEVIRAMGVMASSDGRIYQAESPVEEEPMKTSEGKKHLH